MANVGYARVSTQDQNLSLQLDALAAAGCKKVFEDRASGASADRAGLQAALDYVRDGEVLVVWKLDRLGRDLRHLVNLMHDLTRRGVGLKVVEARASVRRRLVRTGADAKLGGIDSLDTVAAVVAAHERRGHDA